MLKQVQHDTPFITQHCTIRYQVVRIVSMRKATDRNIVRCAIRLWSSGRNIVRCAIKLRPNGRNIACIFCRFRMGMGRYVLLLE